MGINPPRGQRLQRLAFILVQDQFAIADVCLDIVDPGQPGNSRYGLSA